MADVAMQLKLCLLFNVYHVDIKGDRALVVVKTKTGNIFTA